MKRASDPDDGSGGGGGGGRSKSSRWRYGSLDEVRVCRRCGVVEDGAIKLLYHGAVAGLHCRCCWTL